MYDVNKSCFRVRTPLTKMNVFNNEFYNWSPSSGTFLTKDSLKVLQDKMRILCIESFNQEYNQSNILKKKLK